MSRLPVKAAGVVLLFLTLLIVWLFASNLGNTLLLQWAGGDRLTIGSMKGALWGRVEIGQLHYRDGSQVLQIGKLIIDWEPTALFNQLLHIREITVSEMTYQTLQQSDQDQVERAEAIPQLPVALQLDKMLLEQLNIHSGKEQVHVTAISLEAASKENTLYLRDIAVSYQQHQINADSEVLLQESFPLSANIDWQGVLPEVGAASAHIDLNGNLQQIEFQLASKAPVQLQSKGQVNLQHALPNLTFQGQWQQLQWPINGSANVISEVGAFTVDGPVDQLTFRIDSSLHFPQEELPAIEAQLSGELTPAAIHNLKAEIHTLQGSVVAEGGISWSSEPKWDVLFNVDGVDLAKLNGDWPQLNRVNGRSKGGLAGGEVWADVELQELQAELHGYPLTARGRARYVDNQLEVGSLRIDNGPNRFSASGHIGERLDIIYDVKAPTLEASWSTLSGEFTAAGQLRGTPQAPIITADIVAAELGYLQHRAKALRSHLVWQEDRAQGHFEMLDFDLAGQQGTQLSVELDGTPQQHDIRLLLDTSTLQLNAHTRGGLYSSQWQGTLEKIEITQPELGRWSNHKPVALLLSKERVRVEQGCLQQLESRLCTSLQWQTGEAVIEGQFVNLSLKRLMQPLIPQAEFDGQLQGQLTLRGPLEALQGSASLQLPSGQLMLKGEEQELLMPLSGMAVDLTMAPAQNAVEIKLAASGVDIDVDVNTGPLSTTEPISLEGDFHAQIPQLSKLSQLSGLMPELTDLEGSVRLDAKLTGSTEKPEVRGQLQLAKATVNIPALGLQLHEGQLLVESHGHDQLVVKGEVASGEGSVSLDGTLLLDASRGWPAQLSVTGENVLLVRLPEAKIIATPNLVVNIESQQIDIQGYVVIPSAAVEINELPSQIVAPSEDEVIIGPQQQLAESSTGRMVNTQVEVTLGDQVQFSGFGLDTHIEGSVNLHSKQGKNLAKGKLMLKEGRYQAYGQDLTIENGQLLFNGSAQNPGVEIKATRLSKDETVTAILNVNGSLKKPLVTVSSTPALPDEEALAYLLTGRALGEEGADKMTMLRQAAASKGLDKSQDILDKLAVESGVDEIRMQEGRTLEETSLLLGKYLTPDLYVSYAVGLFDSQGALKTRYRLTDQLRVEVQSGISQSMDLIYSVEKN